MNGLSPDFDGALGARMGIWFLRLTWVSLPFVAGAAAGDALSSWSTPTRLVATALLWVAWGIGLVATLAPRPVSLTVLRTMGPLFAVVAVLAVRLLRLDAHRHRLADGQPADGVVEAGDHLARADDEPERISAARGIELLAAVERAAVVDRYPVAIGCDTGLPVAPTRRHAERAHERAAGQQGTKAPPCAARSLAQRLA